MNLKKKCRNGLHYRCTILIENYEEFFSILEDF